MRDSSVYLNIAWVMRVRDGFILKVSLRSEHGPDGSRYPLFLAIKGWCLSTIGRGDDLS